MTDYVCDIETDGLKPSLIHCASIYNMDTKELYSLTTYPEMTEFFYCLTSEDRLIGHNFIRYDKPVIERILDIKLQAHIVDTTALSWYLTPEGVNGKHGLAFWGERLGVAKPVVEDWENLPLETYVHRCEEDVKINTLLWEKQSAMLEKLYEGKSSNRLIRYLEHKMNCAVMQEVSKWKLDIDKANKLYEELTTKYQVSVDALSKVMPQVPKTAKRTRPAKPYKKDGSLSATGEKWDELTKENN